MVPEIPKLSGSSTFRSWCHAFEDRILSDSKVSFLLDPDTTIKEAREAYMKEDYMPGSEFAVMMLERGMEFDAAIRSVREMLFESVDSKLFGELPKGGDLKQLIEGLKQLHEPTPAEESVWLRAEYFAFMESATVKGLGRWIVEWGHLMQDYIMVPMGDVQSDRWKLELAAKLDELAYGHETLNWLKLLAKEICTGANLSFKPATKDEVLQIVKLVRLAFWVNHITIENMEEEVKPSSRPVSRPRGGRKRAGTESGQQGGKRSRPRTNGGGVTCDACGEDGHPLEKCVTLFRRPRNPASQHVTDAAVVYVESRPQLKRRYEAAKAKRNNGRGAAGV
ncbi:hypothetical protein SEPCBS119000_002387 [Sporothrix epigloea]|uniref:CCHC-type domain-containing protein n=1 Tax=Sporothrix epigloea TaxID=1892477 RepID=A0ABP0DJ48_9PEZI